MTAPEHTAAVVAALEAARALLSDAKRWCRGAMARDAHANLVPPTDAAARQWDAIGSLVRHASSPKVSHVARASLFRTVGRSLNAWNDETTHEALLDAFDRTLERIRALQRTGPAKAQPKHAPGTIQEIPSRPADRRKLGRGVQTKKRRGGSL